MRGINYYAKPTTGCIYYATILLEYFQVALSRKKAAVLVLNFISGSKIEIRLYKIL